MFFDNHTINLKWTEITEWYLSGLVDCNWQLHNIYEMKIVTTILAVTAVHAAGLSEPHHIKVIPGGIKGPATTSRYWDCCKPTCAWPGNVGYRTPITSCKADGVSKQDPEVQSGCVGGQAYICTNQAMYAINSSLAYGFVAAGFGESTTTKNMCCACVMLSFKKELAGKKMVVQLTNTGRVGPTEHDMFDIAMPGSGVGYYSQGCTTQWNSDVSNWGDQYGGVWHEADCYKLPKKLWDGCLFRFQWMLGVSNPDVTYEQVECPAELIARTNCTFDDKQ